MEIAIITLHQRLKCSPEPAIILLHNDSSAGCGVKAQPGMHHALVEHIIRLDHPALQNSLLRHDSKDKAYTYHSALRDIQPLIVLNNLC